MDLSKLTDEQLDLAEKVAKRAKDRGLNPDFVLPMVMAESGFNPNARSKKGAIGLMQVTPDTAAFYKCKDPTDIDQNIDCGLSVISDLVSKKNIGNDPYKVLSAYNAGPNTKYFTSGKIEDLPDETINHMGKVSDIYGGALPQVSTGKPKEAEPEKPAPEPEPEDGGEGGPRVAPRAASDIPGVSEANKPFLGIVGGGIGAGVAGSIETGKQILPLVPNLIGRISGNPPGPSTPMSRAGLQSYLNSQIAPNLRLPLTELEKVSGAGKIRTMSEVQNALKAIQAVEEQKVTKPMVRMVPGRPNVFEETGRFTSSTVPGRPGVDLSKYEIPARGPVRQAVGRQMQTAGEVGKSLLPSAGRVGLGALGGANAVMSGYDAWELAKEIDAKKSPSWKDYARLASKTGATIGGGLSMLPFGITQAAGFGLQAPEMIWSGAEALSNAARNATQEQVDRALTNVDPMGNPLGGLP